MSKILSREELEDIRSSVDALANGLNDTVDDLNVTINSFNNEQIVNSFYASGNYGTGVKEKLERIKNAVIKYRDVITNENDGLVVQTKKYVDRQISLVDEGK